MVNTKGMIRRSTYEDVLREVNADTFKDYWHTPNRNAKFYLQSLEMVALDPENEEDIVRFEKNKRREEARRAEVEEVAQTRGVSKAQLELALRPARPQMLGGYDDGLERRDQSALCRVGFWIRWVRDVDPRLELL